MVPNDMKKLNALAIILATIAIVGQIFIFATKKDNTKEDNRPPVAQYLDNNIYSPTLPDSISFAGEPVPLDTYYVREGLDREMISFTFSHTNTMLYFKRANRVFPIIEPILKKYGIPDDFKYLCVIESGLTNATSPAKAQGYWQFMKATAQTYGLEVNDEIDMRNNLEVATEAACRFLKTLYNHLGSWTAAAAAYNCGEGGLTKNMSKQSIKSYYDTRLNAETSRYVYRIIAMKQVMQHPQEYGFFIRHCDLYPTIPTRTTTLSGQNVDLYNFARQNGVSYKVFRDLNPWITTDKLTNKGNKTYTIKLPSENGILLSHILTEKDRSKEYIKSM